MGKAGCKADKGERGKGRGVFGRKKKKKIGGRKKPTVRKRALSLKRRRSAVYFCWEVDSSILLTQWRTRTGMAEAERGGPQKKGTLRWPRMESVLGESREEGAVRSLLIKEPFFNTSGTGSLKLQRPSERHRANQGAVKGGTISCSEI